MVNLCRGFSFEKLEILFVGEASSMKNRNRRRRRMSTVFIPMQTPVGKMPQRAAGGVSSAYEGDRANPTAFRSKKKEEKEIWP